MIEALPESLIGGIYWGLAQVDDGQVYDMVGAIFLLDGILSTRTGRGPWKPTLCTSLTKQTCMADN